MATPNMVGGGGAAGRLGQSQFTPEKPHTGHLSWKPDMPETKDAYKKNKLRPIRFDPLKRIRVKGVIA